MKEELEKLAFKYFCGLFNEEELHEWMQKELDQNKNPDPDMYDLNAKAPYEAAKILLKIAKDKYGFEPYSLGSEPVARKIFKELAEAYLKREVGPLQFCTVIQHLDTIYGDSECDYDEKRGLHIPRYGHWWGDLWNCCDCCDETWTHENKQHIEDELRLVLSQLD